ncbi:MAG: PA14 domain-containing protein, partial [Patescibacteria group bacterium]
RKDIFFLDKDFNNIRTVTNSQLSELSLGQNIKLRPGTYLMKLISDPKVYAVEPAGVIKHISSPAQAELLFGTDWKGRVIDLPDSLYQDYKDGGVLKDNRHPTGMVFRYQGEPDDYYLLTNGYSRKFVSLVSWDGYHFNKNFISDVAYQNVLYPAGADIDVYKVALADTAQTLIVDEADDLINYRKNEEEGVYTNSGLKGDYYTGSDFKTKEFTRTDKNINFSWGSGNPDDQYLNDDYFSVRWTGQINIPEEKNYTFYTCSDDGSRLYIDGTQVVDNWSSHRVTCKSGQITLTRGRHDIKVEYYEKNGGAYMKLSWGDESTTIPTEVLFRQ